MATTSSVMTETMSGTVTGFGSVIIDGVRFDDSMTVAQVEADPSTPTGVRVRDLRLGQTATVSFTEEGGTRMATAVTVAAEVVGLVDSVDVANRKLVVAAQDVRVNIDPAAGPVTVLDGFAGLAGIPVGTRVEVHGMPRTDEVTGKPFVQATRIERKGDGQTFVRVAGVVSALGANTFRIGDLVVGYSSATRVTPASTPLADGQRVAVWSDVPVAGTSLVAKAIRVLRVPGTGTVALSGPVDCGTTTCTTTFKVDGFTVDAASARFLRGTAANLANGVFVRVRGTTDESTARIVASTVAFRDSGEPEIELRGVVSAYKVAQTGTGATFSVRNVLVQTDAATRIRNCAGALSDGFAVEVEGTPGAGAVAAREVKCLPAMDQLSSELRGTIGTASPSLRQFTLANFAGLNVLWSDATVFVNGTSGQLAGGAFVEVEGKVTGSTLAATRVKFATAPGAGEVEVKGIVFGFDGSAFRVGPYTIQVATAALPATFADGRPVEVRFVTAAGGVNMATKVEIER
jgi:hypothetical protein